MPRHSALLAYTWFHCFRIFPTQQNNKNSFDTLPKKITNLEPKLIFLLDINKIHKIQCTYVCRHIIDDHYVRFVSILLLFFLFFHPSKHYFMDRYGLWFYEIKGTTFFKSFFNHLLLFSLKHQVKKHIFVVFLFFKVPSFRRH